ncbi:Eco57I restriction-modification methylase domain-containing protein [Candidatus Neomarinimicrobiota bacterium]
MESLIFSGDAFSEYYLRHILWDEPRLKPLLGLDTVEASYRRSAIEIQQAQRSLRDRQQARSTSTLLLSPLTDILEWSLGEEAHTVETEEGTESAGQPLLVDGKEIARVLCIEPEAPLDLPMTGIHRRFAPTLSMVRVLDELNLTWGIIINAYELRLIRRAEGFVSSHIGFDLTSIAEGRNPGREAWRLLWALLRSEALAAEPMVLERIVVNGREHQDGVSEALGAQVQDAIVAFVQGILSQPQNREKLPDPLPQDNLNQLYTESLRVLYRILFALYAESRNLLPLDLPTYRDGYSISRLAHHVVDQETDPRQHPTTSNRYIEFSLRSLFELLRRGANLGPEGRIPQYNGALFDHSRTELVESLDWGDETAANILEKLTLVSSRTGQVRLSYRELDVEQLGAVYENLLEQSPRITSETMFRILIDGRELIVNTTERQRLAERRGEVLLAGDVATTADEHDEDVPTEEDEEQDSDELTDDDQPERPSSTRPIRVLAEITPGTVYLKSGMGRKQTGSFYTARPLVEFLVRRAIDPLAVNKEPEEILQLKIVDPAMGSGHFLVGACRRLSEHLLAAYRKCFDDVLGEQPDLPPGDLFLEAGVHPEVAANWEQEDRALTACRLLIAGNCIYGVDKNPLAVDLARVSLWLATAATDHPLTFLDHRLRVGDSLLGLPLFLGGDEEPEIHLLKPDQPTRRGRGRGPRMVDSPMFENARMLEAISRGTRKLREHLRRALQHLKTISDLMHERPGDFTGHRTAFEAMQGELKPFIDLHTLRIGREFFSLEHAAEMELVNKWLDEIGRDDRPSEDSERQAQPFLQRGQEIGAFCWQLAFPEVFFNGDGQIKDNPGFDAVIGNPPWDKIKPNERECFSDFDPTVWDVQGQERTRLIEALKRDNSSAAQAWEAHESEMKTLSNLLLDGGFYEHQIAEVEEKKTGGDPDTFKFFTERAWQLLHPEGYAGIIVPFGIQASLGTTGLRRLLLDECQLQALIKLDNERFIFPGVFHGQKFDLLVFTKGGSSDTFDTAFFSWEPADVVLRLENDPRHMTVEASLYRELSPEQYTFVELRDQSEVELLRRIYREFPRLGEKLEDTWNVSFTAEFHMKNKSYLFRDAARLIAFDATLHGPLPSTVEVAVDTQFSEDEIGEYWTTEDDSYYAEQPQRFVKAERWVDSRGRIYLPGNLDERRIAYSLTGYVLAGEEEVISALPIKPGEKYVPLYEGRMVHQFDHCQKGYVSGSGRRARWIELPWLEKRIVPHYFMAISDFQTVQSGRQQFRAGFVDVTGPGNERSALCTIIPADCPSGNSVPTVISSDDEIQVSLLFTVLLNSFVADALLRKTVSNHLNFFVLNALAIPRPDITNEAVVTLLRNGGKLVCTSAHHATLWGILAQHWPDDFLGEWSRDKAYLDTSERAKLRADIDARVAMIFGFSAQEYARVLSTFPALDQDQPRLPGDCFIRQTNKGEKIQQRGFITRDLALLKFFEHSEQEPPSDIVRFYDDVDIDIERNTGTIRDLRVRVEEATRRGAVAYNPTQYKGWRPEQTPFLPPDLPPALAENWDGRIDEYVVRDSQINNGEPTLAGTRIAVQMIYDLLQQGWTFTQVLESYPHLSLEQVAIALRWGDLQ